MGKQAKIKQQRKSERSTEEEKTQEKLDPQAWMPSWLKKRFPNLKIGFLELIIWAALFGITSAVLFKTFV